MVDDLQTEAERRMKREVLPWTDDEKNLLADAVGQHGKNWKVLQEKLPNKTLNQIKYFYQKNYEPKESSGKPVIRRVDGSADPGDAHDGSGATAMEVDGQNDGSTMQNSGTGQVDQLLQHQQLHAAYAAAQQMMIMGFGAGSMPNAASNQNIGQQLTQEQMAQQQAAQFMMAQAAAQQMLHAQLAAQGYRFASQPHQQGPADDAGATQNILAAQAQAQAAQFLMQMAGAAANPAGMNAQIQSLLHSQQLFQQQALLIHQQQQNQQQQNQQQQNQQQQNQQQHPPLQALPPSQLVEGSVEGEGEPKNASRHTARGGMESQNHNVTVEGKTTSSFSGDKREGLAILTVGEGDPQGTTALLSPSRGADDPAVPTESPPHT